MSTALFSSPVLCRVIPQRGPGSCPTLSSSRATQRKFLRLLCSTSHLQKPLAFQTHPLPQLSEASTGGVRSRFFFFAVVNQTLQQSTFPGLVPLIAASFQKLRGITLSPKLQGNCLSAELLTLTLGKLCEGCIT